MKIEDVIKGLECCSYGGCGGPKDCPYFETDACEVKLMADALALLKGREPRVMTLEEIRKCGAETVWFETRPDNKLLQLTKDEIAALSFIGELHNWNGYNTNWRCWTSRPTDEQREAVKWNE